MRRSAGSARLFVAALLGGLVGVAGAGCTCQGHPGEGASAPAPAVAPPVAPPVAPTARGPTSAPAPAAASPRADAATDVVSTPLTACRGDADCVTVAGDCCGCAAGGSQGVVTRAKQGQLEAARAARCAAAMCITMMSTHPTCALQPRCVNGSCRLVPPRRAAGAPPPPAPMTGP